MTNRNHWKFPNLLHLSGLLVVLSTGAHAATLSYISDVAVSEDQNAFNLSVFDGKAEYSGNGNSGTLGDGTVVDYNFYENNGATASNTPTALTSYASGSAGLISGATANYISNINGGSLDWGDVWTSTDPGVNFSTTADFTTATVARAQDLDLTIDISGLLSGSVYVIHGTFSSDDSTVSLTMTGAGQPDESASQSISPATNINEGYITRFDFADAGAYSEIALSYTNSDTDASRARFMGVIIDGTAVPEPSAFALLGVCGLILLRRRR